ncbi:DUF998 domain-containing protein [Streptosporangium sp. NPDC000396]|uniref:DUF998 domain-containing protein n=1 Tax=Streptosporangium sp. NPDC000396 TaxID=3366185 RepID=UPI0036C95DEF
MSGGPVRRWPGIAGVAAALVSMAYAHVAADAVNPMTGPISDYTRFDAGAWATALGTIMLALASLWVAYGLTRVEPVRGAAARVLFIAAALGLLLTATFPADPAPGAASIGGEIHNWSAAVVFTALPCAGWMLGRRLGKPALPAVSALSVVFLAAFLATQPGSLTAGLIGGPDYHGPIERLLVLSTMALVFLAARGVGGRDAVATTRLSRWPSGAGAMVPAQPSAEEALLPRRPVGLGSA